MRPNSNKCMPYNKAECEACTRTEPEKFVYLLHFDVLGGDVPTDSAENMLDCIRLKLERHGEDRKGNSKGKAFALCLL